MSKPRNSKADEDLRIPTTPHKLAKAVLRGGAPRRKAAKKS